MPWDIDGISMGRDAKKLKISRNRILVRTIQIARIYAATIEIIVPVPAAKMEFFNACLNVTDPIMAETSASVMYMSIQSRGRIIVIVRNIIRRNLTDVELNFLTGKPQYI
jgi:hypothetical protein